MIIWICTDMEGLAGVDRWQQCYDPDDDSPVYRYGREQLTADVNAAVAGCFDAGATEVRVLDGHGRNHNKGFIDGVIDPRITRAWIAQRNPVRWEGLDESVNAIAMIGQHAMAGTLGAFADHTQMAKDIIRLKINGVEYGEMGQMALYAGAFGIPLIHVSGDESLCAEAARQFPQAVSTPTKRGIGFETCKLYPVDEVRANIRRDIARAITGAADAKPWSVDMPVQVEIEWSWSGAADRYASVAGVTRVDARTVAWHISDPRDIFSMPCREWQPS